MMATMTLGEALRAARLKRLMTAQELGARIGVDQRVISRWENDKARPRLSSLRKIADALGLSYDELAALLADAAASDS